MRIEDPQVTNAWMAVSARSRSATGNADWMEAGA
jgi:hypothetical protein